MDFATENIKRGGIAGLVAALVMFIPMMILTKGLGVAPFEMPPSAALLYSQGMPPMPGGPVLHFLYGIFWAVLFFAYFKHPYTLKQAFGLSLVMWLIMQLIMAPLIGWGLFGSDAGHLDGNALALGPTPKYLMVTIVFHLIYGLVLGLMAKRYNDAATSQKPAA